MTDSLSLEALRRGFLERALGVSWLRGRNLCMAFLALTCAKEQPERLQQFLFLSKIFLRDPAPQKSVAALPCLRVLWLLMASFTFFGVTTLNFFLLLG